MYYFSDFQSATCINTEEQEDLDVPLVFVFFPESKDKQHNYRLLERCFRVEMHLQGHIITHDETWKLLLDTHDIEGSTINESAEVTTKLHIKEPNNDNSKADHSTAQEVLSSNNSTALVVQLPDNARPVERDR